MEAWNRDHNGGSRNFPLLANDSGRFRTGLTLVNGFNPTAKVRRRVIGDGAVRPWFWRLRPVFPPINSLTNTGYLWWSFFQRGCPRLPWHTLQPGDTYPPLCSRSKPLRPTQLLHPAWRRSPLTYSNKAFLLNLNLILYCSNIFSQY